MDVCVKTRTGGWAPPRAGNLFTAIISQLRKPGSAQRSLLFDVATHEIYNQRTLRRKRARRCMWGKSNI